MFNQREFHHPYKETLPKSPPAGFRFADYINVKRYFNILDLADMPSPDPSPLNSPVKGPRPLAEESSSIPHIPGRFPRPDGPQATRASAPTPDEQRAKNAHINTFSQAPLPQTAPRKGKHGPKHLSFTKSRSGSGTIPHHRHAQKMKDKLGAGHRRSRERRRVPRPCNLATLRREAQMLMKPEHMNDEDRIFLEQIRELELNENMTQGLEQYREQMVRAAAETDQRRKEHKARDKEAAQLWGGRHDEEALEEQKRKVAEFVRDDEEIRAAHFREMEEAALRADEERQRVHEARERQLREEQERQFREERARKAEEERRKREEEEQRKREERERRQREERERQLREERRRRLQEHIREFQRREQAFARRIREQKERLAREEHQRAAREERERMRRERIERERIAKEEHERQARILSEKAERERQYFLMYEAKWNELRTNDALPLVEVWDMPWPVFGIVSSAEEIIYQDVQTFLFHPQRPGVEGKTPRDKVKAEVLRFHPDKFNTRILPKIQPSQQADAQAIAGAVARILTSIMTEEAEQEN